MEIFGKKKKMLFENENKICKSDFSLRCNFFESEPMHGKLMIVNRFFNVSIYIYIICNILRPHFLSSIFGCYIVVDDDDDDVW